MHNNITELVFILDRSGSMSGLEGDTIGGFNAMLKKQRSQEGKVLVSTVLFSTKSTVLHDRADIATVPDMTSADYLPGGCTALMDALGDAIRHIRLVHKYARPEDVPAHTLFVITTDGMENASHRYFSDDIKALIETQKKEHGWEFLFRGANIDAVETASRYGIEETCAVDYCCDSEGTATNFDAISDVVTEVRRSRPIQASWKDRITALKNRPARKAGD